MQPSAPESAQTISILRRTMQSASCKLPATDIFIAGSKASNLAVRISLAYMQLSQPECGDHVD